MHALILGQGIAGTLMAAALLEENCEICIADPGQPDASLDGIGGARVLRCRPRPRTGVPGAGGALFARPAPPNSPPVVPRIARVPAADLAVHDRYPGALKRAP